MKKLISIATLSALFLVSFTAMAFAMTGDVAAATASDSLGDVIRAVVDAFKAGNPAVGVLLGVVAIVALARKHGPGWLNRRPWPALLVLVSSFAATLAELGPKLASVTPALTLAATAAGGYALLSQLGAYALEKWPKMPGWLRTALNAVVWLFGKPGDDEIANAEKAGQDAVDADKPDGTGPTSSLR